MEDPKKESSDKDLTSEVAEVDDHDHDQSSTPREMGCGHQHDLTRQQSLSRSTLAPNCLCSPTTHLGSFRCRLHRSPSFNRSNSLPRSPRLQRTKSSIAYASSSSPRPGRLMEATPKPSAG